MIPSLRKRTSNWPSRWPRQSGSSRICARAARARTDAIRQLNEERLALEGQRNQAGKDAREKADQLMRLQGEVSALDKRHGRSHGGKAATG